MYKQFNKIYFKTKKIFRKLKVKAKKRIIIIVI